jgi:hypothetical protein
MVLLVGLGALSITLVAKKIVEKHKDNRDSRQSDDIKQVTYSTLELIEDIKRDIQLLSEDLSVLYTSRSERFKLTDLSVYWGRSSGYIANLKYIYNKNPNNFHVDEGKLNTLENIIKDRLGEKSSGCEFLFGEYRAGKTSFWDFIEQLRLELGRVSGLVELTIEETNEIFGFLVDDLIQRITNPNRKWNNPYYKFSLEKLDNIIENVKAIFGYRAIKLKERIDTYKRVNPDLKEYSLQAHNVDNPHYFSNINSGEIIKAYLFGFMMADGYIESNGNSIGIELRETDKSILIRFKEALGVGNDIKNRVVFKRYKGELEKYTQSRLRFGCRPMWRDLKSLEYTSSKEVRKSVPGVIKNLVLEAKREEGSNWYETVPGKTALAWLLGFYDGDGAYSHSGGDYGVLYSASRQFLEDVKEIFGFNHEVKEKEKSGDIVHVFDEELISKGYYYLMIDRLPVDLFLLMFDSYSDSLARKRPDKNPNSINFLGLIE